MRVFGIDPGSERTGYGCVETDGSRHRLVVCGAIATSPSRPGSPRNSWSSTSGSPRCWPSAARTASPIESLFHAVNVRSALKLGHARGVAVLAAVEGGYPVVEYTPAADQARGRRATAAPRSTRCRRWCGVLLGLAEVPSPHDAADALAVAICHVHATPSSDAVAAAVAAAGTATGRGAGSGAGATTGRRRQ